MPDVKDLPQLIDRLGQAEARQTSAWLRMMGLETELMDARRAWLELATTLGQAWNEARDEWAAAKTDAAKVSTDLDGLLT